MPSIETTDWLALKAHLDTLVTNPVMQIFEPGAIVSPPVQTEQNWEGGETWSNGEGWDQAGLPMPFILLSDVTNDPVRMGIDPRLHIRSGTLMLALQWPIARALTHTQIKELAGQIAAHFPADTCMTFGPSRLRVAQDAAAMPSYIEGAYRVAVVRVLWSSM